MCFIILYYHNLHFSILVAQMSKEYGTYVKPRKNQQYSNPLSNQTSSFASQQQFSTAQTQLDSFHQPTSYLTQSSPLQQKFQQSSPYIQYSAASYSKQYVSNNSNQMSKRSFQFRRFSLEERQILKQSVQQFGTNWVLISQQLQRQPHEVQKQWENWESQPEWEDYDNKKLIMLWDQGSSVADILVQFPDRSYAGVHSKLTVLNNHHQLQRQYIAERRSFQQQSPLQMAHSPLSQQSNSYQSPSANNLFSQLRTNTANIKNSLAVRNQKRALDQIFETKQYISNLRNQLK